MKRKLTQDEVKTLSYSDIDIYSVSAVFNSKIIIIKSEGARIGFSDGYWVGKGELKISGWDKILVSVTPNEKKYVELPQGIIESLNAIHIFKLNGNDLDIGGFSSDDSGKWLDYKIVGVQELTGEFEETHDFD